MKKIYSTIFFTLFLSIFIGCNATQAEYDPSIIKDLSTVQKSDFIQLKDGRLMAVYAIWCEPDNPEKCELLLRTGYGTSYEPFRMTLKQWAPQVERITRYGDPTWTMLAKKYLDNQ